MPYNQILTHTLSNRIFGCSYYKQEKNYVYRTQLLSKKIVMEYTNSIKDCRDFSFFNILSEWINKRKNYYSSINDKEFLNDTEELVVAQATNLSHFFHTYNTTHLMDSYLWRSRVKGSIVCRTTINSKEYNVDFSYKNSEQTYYDIYYYRFNFWLYNKVNDLEHDGLVYLVNLGTYYLIKYNENDYTMKRGFLSNAIKNRKHRPGYQCLTCLVKECRPRLITNIERI